MRLLICILIILVAIFPSVSADINVTTKSIGETYIEWQWDTGYNLTAILIDSTEVCGYETTANTYLLSGLEPDSLHSINITNGTDYGDNISTTLPHTQTDFVHSDSTTGIAIMFGVAGGFIGAMILSRRGNKQ